MSMALYERVALRRDVGEHGLRKGDVGTIVDRVPHPGGDEDGYVLEVFNALGDSIATLTVRASEVELLRKDEVLAVRPLARAG